MYISGENLTLIGIPFPSFKFFSLEGNFSISNTRSAIVVGSVSGRSVVCGVIVDGDI